MYCRKQKMLLFSNSSSISLNILLSNSSLLNSSPLRTLRVSLSITAPQASCFSAHNLIQYQFNTPTVSLPNLYDSLHSSLFVHFPPQPSAFFLLDFSSPVSSVDFERNCWNHHTKIIHWPNTALARQRRNVIKNYKKHVSA